MEVIIEQFMCHGSMCGRRNKVNVHWDHIVFGLKKFNHHLPDSMNRCTINKDFHSCCSQFFFFLPIWDVAGHKTYFKIASFAVAALSIIVFIVSQWCMVGDQFPKKPAG